MGSNRVKIKIPKNCDATLWVFLWMIRNLADPLLVLTVQCTALLQRFRDLISQALQDKGFHLWCFLWNLLDQPRSQDPATGGKLPTILSQNLGCAEVFSDVRLQMLGALQSGGPKFPQFTWKFEDITFQLKKSSSKQKTIGYFRYMMWNHIEDDNVTSNWIN